MVVGILTDGGRIDGGVSTRGLYSRVDLFLTGYCMELTQPGVDRGRGCGGGRGRGRGGGRGGGRGCGRGGGHGGIPVVLSRSQAAMMRMEYVPVRARIVPGFFEEALVCLARYLSDPDSVSLQR